MCDNQQKGDKRGARGWHLVRKKKRQEEILRSINQHCFAGKLQKTAESLMLLNVLEHRMEDRIISLLEMCFSRQFTD